MLHTRCPHAAYTLITQCKVKENSQKVAYTLVYVIFFLYLCSGFYKNSNHMKKLSFFASFALMVLMLMPCVRVYGDQAYLRMSFVDDNGTPVRMIEVAIGQEVDEPHLVITPSDAQVRVTYSSSDPSVATVDMMSGEVTPLAVGVTAIRATSAETAEYYGYYTTYNVKVVAPHDTTPVIEPTCPDAHFYMNGVQVTSLTLKVGESVSVPMLMSATGSMLSGRVSIQNPSVATVSADNMIHGLATGTTQLFVSTVSTVEGQVLTCDYSLTLNVEAAAPQKQSPELSWSDTMVYAELGVPCAAPILYNPHNVPMNKIESQNPNVAEVSEDGSVLTIKGVGDAMIFAESFETSEYYAQSVSYMVHVSTLGLRVKGINVTSLNAADVLGDGSYNVTFEKESRTLHLNSWNIDAIGLTGLNAMIEDEGTTVPLTIMLHGANSITNVPTCIKSTGVPVIVMGQSMRDVLTMHASDIAVNTPYFKIHQCAVNAEASLAALKLGNELGVSKNSRLLASSINVAIQCKTFVMAEGEEGVAILTPDVRFEMNKGFVTANKQFAKEVEIGKVPVVAPSDEVTTIDFAATDPEGNETVVFSASADDTYNEETGQLELVTALTDEVVADALENLVPGSSAWIDLLPGSLVFDIPAGEGKLQVQCMTLMGYTLQVKMEGQAVVSISQTSLGWAEVTYNVPAPIHVVIYLHASSANQAPARIATRMEDAITAGAYIQAVKIVPNDAPTAIEHVTTETEGTSRVMREGQVYILRGDKVYTITGQEVK